MQRNGVFFISGDVHFGDITRYDCGTGYPLYDITSSGITQSVEKAIPRPLAFLVRVVAWLTPTTMRVTGPQCRFKSCTYDRLGCYPSDYEDFQIRDVNGNPVHGVNISLSDLQNQGVRHKTAEAGKYLRHCSLETTLPWLDRHRLIILFACSLAGALLTVFMAVYAPIMWSRKLVHKCKFD
ncbi:hypothetical protein MKX01_015395 [Papaver californicum]|nr:hypothetical protein MKX01_015395 [Papaver californicum]